MKVISSKDRGNVAVEDCLGHTIHEKKIRQFRIPGQLRQEIVGKLAKGVKIESILGEICNKVGGGIFRDLMDCKGIIYIKHQLNVDYQQKTFCFAFRRNFSCICRKNMGEKYFVWTLPIKQTNMAFS